MIEDICEALAKHFPHTALRIRQVYLFCGSWDQTLRFLDASAASHIDPLTLARSIPVANPIKERPKK